MDVGLIHLTIVAETRLRGGFERMRQAMRKMNIVLVEHDYLDVEATPQSGKRLRSAKITMVRFPGPWLALCGYKYKREVKGWIPINLVGEKVFLLPSLVELLRNHLIDERVVCDPVTGLSHTGLYLRKW